MYSEHASEGHLENNQIYLEGNMPINEVQRLAKLAKEGDKEAEEALILGHLKLVNFMIQKYRDRGVPYEDLFQEGCIALIQAVKNYDYTRDIMLSSYASYYIVRNVQRAIMKAEMIRKPEALCLEIKRYKYIRNALHIEYGRMPTNKEIANEMGVSEAHIKEIKNRIYMYISLDALTKNANEKGDHSAQAAMKRILEPRDPNEPVDIQVFRKMGLLDFKGFERFLTVRERKVISLRFSQKEGNLSFRDIGKRMNCSSESARLLYVSAVKKIEEHMGIKNNENRQNS